MHLENCHVFVAANIKLTMIMLLLLLLKMKRLEWNYARMLQGHFTYVDNMQ